MTDDLSPRDAQHAARGRLLIRTGWALRVTGTVVGLAGGLLFRGGLNSDHIPEGFTQGMWWLQELAGLVVLVIGLYVFGAGRRRVVRGKQHTADVIVSAGQLAGTRYVLYLRPFANDPAMASLPRDFQGGGSNAENLFFLTGLTYEEALVRRFRHLGRVVAIGRPGEPLPLPGAARAYLPVDDWQDTVSELIGGAHVVMLSAGPGPGTVWEFAEALRVLPPTRLVLLAYCEPAEYDLFREAVAEEYARRARGGPGTPDPHAGAGTEAWPPLPALPDFPPLAHPQRPRWQVLLSGGRRKPRWDFVLKGLIVFGPDWKATFVRFDPTAKRLAGPGMLNHLVKRELQPIMEQLNALPARN
ncbi:hypothetical protein [Streptomyces sp. XH2]|uniref:hypothetical protein n=1 Tax=Streptomyces sp. XH2 TaxID=3412483 RepID=UPI003C7BC44C